MTAATTDAQPDTIRSASRDALARARYGGLINPATKRRTRRWNADVIEGRNDENGELWAIRFRCPMCRGFHWNRFYSWNPDVGVAHCGAPAATVALRWAGEVQQPDTQHVEINPMPTPGERFQSVVELEATINVGRDLSRATNVAPGKNLPPDALTERPANAPSPALLAAMAAKTKTTP